MDELDLVLESLDLEPKTETTTEMNLDPDVSLALDEFQNAERPEDRVEALRLLLQLIK